MSTTFPHLILFFLIFIVNVHLIFNFFREPDVHALQIALFFQQLHKILPQSSKHTSPWIVCGDFNMHADFPVYEMLRHGKLFIDSVEKLNPAKWKYPEFVKQNEVGLLIWYMIFGRLLAKRAASGGPSKVFRGCSACSQAHRTQRWLPAYCHESIPSGFSVAIYRYVE